MTGRGVDGERSGGCTVGVLGGGHVVGGRYGRMRSGTPSIGVVRHGGAGRGLGVTSLRFEPTVADVAIELPSESETVIPVLPAATGLIVNGESPPIVMTPDCDGFAEKAPL
jgi:hypothetical protein